LINVLEEGGGEGTIPADPDRAVKQVILRIPGSVWVRIDKDREVAGTVHTLQETNKAFQLIVKRTRDRSTPPFKFACQLP